MKTIFQAFRMLIVLTVLTGIVYPLAVTGISALAFPRQASGSLVTSGGQLLGSELLAQKFDGPGYFRSRPSAADYATVPSGASNKGPTSADLAKAIAERRTSLGEGAPIDLLTSSASGLDPHISPAAARFQIPRVSSERGIAQEALAQLVARLTEGPQWGIFGEPRVNVFALNRALDTLK